MKAASPMYTNPFELAVSPVTGSRQISTFATSTPSSAQPLSGIAPETLAVPSTGVSNAPKGLLPTRTAADTLAAGEGRMFGVVRIAVPAPEPFAGRAEDTLLTVNDPRRSK